MYELHHGDCLSVIKNLPDNSIDMVLADPPYGTTRNAWDTPIDFSALWPELWRVAKPNAAVCLFSQMPFTVDLVQSQRKWFRYEWIIEKSNATGFLNAYKMPLKCHENLLVSSPTARRAASSKLLVTSTSRICSPTTFPLSALSPRSTTGISAIIIWTRISTANFPVSITAL